MACCLLLVIAGLNLSAQVRPQEKRHKRDSVGTIVNLNETIFLQRDSIFTKSDTTIIIKEILVRHRDTLVAKKHVRISGKRKIFSKRDTLISIADTIVLSIDTVVSFNDRVLKKIEDFSKKDNLFSKMSRNIFVFEDKIAPVDSTYSVPAEQKQMGSQRYNRYNGKIIGNIDIEVLDVFGGTVNDPKRKAKSLLEKAGNFVHIQTHKSIIRNKLLFASNDKLNSLKIADSERLLRQTNFVYDAKIIVKPRAGNDTVDVIVLSQDVWSITGSANYDPAGNSKSISLQDANFLGLGQQIDNGLTLQKSLPSGFNYTGSYVVNNVYKTQSTAQIYYRYEHGEKKYGAGINREFLTPAMRWVGGVNYNRNQIYIIGLDSLRTPLGFNNQDLWLGYAAKTNHANAYNSDRVIMMARMLRTYYFERPDIRHAREYNNNYFYLTSIGYINRKFLKDNYIFRLGRTEDIPEGVLMTVTSGWQTGEGLSRPYFGALSTWSRYRNNIGYMYASAGIGAFADHLGWDDGSYYAKFLYYTPLMKLGDWKWRSFISARSTHVINSNPDVLINVNRENGLRGLNSGLLSGTNKFVLNYENDFFPDFNFLGFRFGMMFYADMAWISGNDKLFDKTNFYQGYGIGIRIRNEHLIFPMIQVLFGYYPNAGKVNQGEFEFFERTKYFYNFNDFEFLRPSTIPLN